MTSLFKKILAIAVALAALAAPPDAVASEYKIGPQDKLRIKVHEWPALSDEVVVNSDGLISLPLIGALKAEGTSPTEIARAIAGALQDQAKLSELPHASVEVSQFRSFYILGEVQRPGDYQYRPGLTVLMALSIAGGRYRLPETAGLSLGRDVIQSRQTVAAAETKSRELRIRLARLQAELNGKDKVDLEAVPGEETYPEDILREERSLLTARTKLFQNQVTALRRQIEISTEEIRFLKARMETAIRQQVSVDKEMVGQKNLSDRGLGLAPRQAALERLSAQIEGDQRDIDTRITQARQSIASAEAAIAKLADERQRDLGVEIRTASEQLAELDHQIRLHQDLMTEAEALTGTARQLGNARQVRLSYRIIRTEADGPREFPAEGNDRVEPGDVIMVDQHVGGGALPSRPSRPPISGAPSTQAPRAPISGALSPSAPRAPISNALRTQ